MATPVATPGTQLRYDPVQLLGTVVQSQEGGTWLVRCDGKDWRVRRAASCLLIPAAGDEVLIAGPIPERVYLIAIVRQADPGIAHLELEGDVHIASTTGRVSIQAAQGLDLRCNDSMGLASESICLRSRHGQLSVDEMHYLGRRADIALGTLSWVGSLCEVAVERLTQVADSVLRLVRNTDQVRAGRVDYEAEESARLHGGHTLVTAKNLVKVDADQIHMG